MVFLGTHGLCPAAVVPVTSAAVPALELFKLNENRSLCYGAVAVEQILGDHLIG